MLNQFSPGRIYRSKLWYQGKPVLDQDGEPIVMRYQLLRCFSAPALRGRVILAVEYRCNNGVDVTYPGSDLFGYRIEPTGEQFIWAIGPHEFLSCPLSAVVQWPLLAVKTDKTNRLARNLIYLRQGQLVVVR